MVPGAGIIIDALPGADEEGDGIEGVVAEVEAAEDPEPKEEG